MYGGFVNLCINIQKYLSNLQILRNLKVGV